MCEAGRRLGAGHAARALPPVPPAARAADRSASQPSQQPWMQLTSASCCWAPGRCSPGMPSSLQPTVSGGPVRLNSAHAPVDCTCKLLPCRCGVPLFSMPCPPFLHCNLNCRLGVCVSGEHSRQAHSGRQLQQLSARSCYPASVNMRCKEMDLACPCVPPRTLTHPSALPTTLPRRAGTPTVC